MHCIADGRYRCPVALGSHDHDGNPKSTNNTNLAKAILGVLENFISNALSIHHETLSYRRLLYTTVPMAIIYFIGNTSVISMRDVFVGCYWFNPSLTMASRVEKRLCMMVFEGVFMTSLAL